jgi:ATP-binding cassette, subfamily B, bacterial PglK
MIFKIFNNCLKLFEFFEIKQKFEFYLIIFYMVIYSLLEIISIGLLIPFVTIILSPDKIFEFQIIKNLFFIEELKQINLQLFFTLFFISAILISNVFRIFVVYKVSLYSKMIPLNLSTKIYKNIINTNYKDFKNKNSSQMVSIIVDKMDSLSGVLYNFLNASAALIASLGIIVFLFFLNFKMALFCFIVGVSIYFMIGFLVKKTLDKNSEILKSSSFNRVKHIKETFGSIKQLIIDNKQSLLTKIFNSYELNYRKAQFIHQFFNTSPRFIVEALGIIFISFMILILSQVLKYEPILIISTVGIIAYSFQKLLPNFNSIYVCYTSLVNYSTFIEEVYFNLKEFKLIETKIKDNNDENQIYFKDKIELKNISFKYNNNGTEIIKSKSFEIKKGSMVFLKGETGSGKTTFLDILMGLLKPTEGSMKVDGKLITDLNVNFWQKNISHVPQDIFLLDATIKQNIAFNFKDDDMNNQEIIKSAKLAEIHDFIDSLPKKYETRVGEDGKLLSGGQKQRIGIARALYRNKEILTLDEATSALDITTEEKILNNLKKLEGITLIQITHRDTSKLGYDKIINF